jgi:hypothetical protein
MNPPPRYVPTLTEIVLPLSEASDTATFAADVHGPGGVPPPEADALIPPPPSACSAPLAAVQLGPLISSTLEDELVERVLLRVNRAIEQRLQDAVAQLLLKHTEELTLALNETIADTITRTASEAFAHELSNLTAGGQARALPD